MGLASLRTIPADTAADCDISAAWQRTRYDPSEIVVSFADEAQKILCHMAAQEIDFSDTACQIPFPLRAAVAQSGRRILNGLGALIVRTGAELSPAQRQKAVWIIALCLGEPLVQDSEGNRLIHVFDRDRRRRMSDGARYHQTREGGSLHTDNVNAPDPWEFLVFGCVEPALIGGESVLTHADLIHRRLESLAPEALEILRQPFFWEYRGIADALYEAPVISYDEQGRPHFRYLRPYLESAHGKAGVPLSEHQAWALDVLDSAMELGDLQLRLSMRAGDILITHDSRVLHGRTSFADHFRSATLADAELYPQLKIRRSFERAWVRSALTS